MPRFGLNLLGSHHIGDIYELDHARAPGRVIYCSESYPLEAFASWMGVSDHPYVIGDFVWTAIDYQGEAGIGWLGYPQRGAFYPWNLAWCGDIDVCGWKRPQSCYRDVLWRKDQLSVFVRSPVPSYPTNPGLAGWSKWNWDDVWASWNWKGYEEKALEVNVYSSCDSVELFLNDRSCGRKPTNRLTEYKTLWSVPWQPGTLKAIGITAGKPVKETMLCTAGDPARIRLTADRTRISADGQDLCYITVELLDARGNSNPLADNLLDFRVVGPATIVGTGNADPRSTESDQLPKRKAWKGKCLVILKAGKAEGPVTLIVHDAGLPEQKIIIQAQMTK